MLSPLLARGLGPAGRGQAALVGAYDEASTALFNCGVPLAVGFFSKEGRQTDQALLRAAAKFGFVMLPLSAAVAIGVVVGPLRSFPRVDLALAVALVALSPLANTFGIACRQLLFARGDLIGIRNVNLIQNLARAGVITGAYGLGMLTVPLAIAATGFTAYLGNAYAWRRGAVSGLSKATASPMRPLLAFGLRALPGSLANFANTRLDQLLIAPFLGVHDLGLYAVAVALNFLPLQVGAAIGTGAFSRVTLGDPIAARATAARAIRAALLMGGAGALLTALGAWVGLRLVYGDAFAGALQPTLVLLPGTVAFGAYLVQAQVAIALGRPELDSYSQFFGVLATVGLLPVLIPTLGITGAALASTVAYIARTMLTATLLRRQGVVVGVPTKADVLNLLTIQRRSR